MRAGTSCSLEFSLFFLFDALAVANAVHPALKPSSCQCGTVTRRLLIPFEGTPSDTSFFLTFCPLTRSSLTVDDAPKPKGGRWDSMKAGAEGGDSKHQLASLTVSRCRPYTRRITSRRDMHRLYRATELSRLLVNLQHNVNGSDRMCSVIYVPLLSSACVLLHIMTKGAARLMLWLPSVLQPRRRYH